MGSSEPRWTIHGVLHWEKLAKHWDPCWKSPVMDIISCNSCIEKNNYMIWVEMKEIYFILYILSYF